MLTKIIDEKEIESIITETYEGDEMLFQKYHYINSGAKDSIADTVSKIKNAVYLFFCDFYRIDDNSGCAVGYLVVMKDAKTLFSFGLNINKRTKENKELMLQHAGELLGSEYFMYLYNKNTRAIQYLLKNGFTVFREIREDEKDQNSELVTILKNDRCQFKQD